ncbi:MAG: response regulator [Bdellovibrionota bacterium]
MLTQNKFVLVVEDDVDLCNSVEGALQNVGFRAVGAHCLRDGVLKVQSQSFICILLDMQLGALRGEDIIEHARNRVESLNRDTPIVVISGHLDRPLVKSLSGKVQGALVKPFDTNNLIEIVRKVTKVA